MNQYPLSAHSQISHNGLYKTGRLSSASVVEYSRTQLPPRSNSLCVHVALYNSAVGALSSPYRRQRVTYKIIREARWRSSPNIYMFLFTPLPGIRPPAWLTTKTYTHKPRVKRQAIHAPFYTVATRNTAIRAPCSFYSNNAFVYRRNQKWFVDRKKAPTQTPNTATHSEKY